MAPPAMTLTIPELREAYEKIMALVTSELSKSAGKVSGALLKDVQDSWKTYFGKELEADYAKSLVDYMNSEMSRKKNARKTLSNRNRSRKSQNGGMAPLDYHTRAGIAGVYGVFPPYVGSGFEVGVPQISQATLCGKVDTTPAVTAMIGSNQPLQNGGKRSTRRRSTRRRTLGRSRSRKNTAGGASIILSTNPTTVIQDMVRGWNGQIPAASSPSPVDTAFEKYLPK
jgi:hypothetical protein